MRIRGLLGYPWSDSAMGDLMTQNVLQSRIRPSQGLHDVIGDRADLLQHPSPTKPTAHGQPLEGLERDRQAQTPILRCCHLNPQGVTAVTANS